MMMVNVSVRFLNLHDKTYDAKFATRTAYETYELLCETVH